MDYLDIIKHIYKLLRVYEKYEFQAYRSYLASLIQILDGIDCPTIQQKESILRLKGLYKWTEEETTHKIVKDCVLDSCNRLEREHRG